MEIPPPTHTHTPSTPGLGVGNLRINYCDLKTEEEKEKKMQFALNVFLYNKTDFKYSEDQDLAQDL